MRNLEREIEELLALYASCGIDRRLIERFQLDTQNNSYIKVKNRIENYIQFRRERRLDELFQNPSFEYPNLSSVFRTGFHLYSKDFHPVYIEALQYCDVGRLVSEHNENEIMNYYIYTFEYCK